MTRADRLVLVRQLRDEGLSQRAIAKRLKVSKDTVRRDVERLDIPDAPDNEPDTKPDDEPTAQPEHEAAPQASEAAAPDTVTDSAPDTEPPSEPVAQLPRRVARPLDGFDPSQWRSLRRDLAVLAQTGRSPEALVHQAVTALAHHYGKALARGEVQAGLPVIVRDMTLCQVVPAADRPVTP